MVRALVFETSVRPHKRARLEWSWWRPGRVVLLLQERSERGWQTMHRTMLREQHWPRAFGITATWIGLPSGKAMVVQPVDASPEMVLRAIDTDTD